MAIKALYHLEDVNDSSGEGHTLTNTGGVTFTPANFGNGANLGTPNSSKYLVINDALDIGGGAITINIWFRLLAEIGAAAPNWYLARHYSSTGRITEFIRYDYNGGTRRICINRTKIKTSDNPIYKTITLGTADFHMITLTYDTTNLRGYYNGVLFDTLATSGNGARDDGNWFYIGNTTYPDILADEVSVYNTALGQPEITALYNKKISDAGFFPFMCKAYKKGEEYFRKKRLYLPNNKLFKPKLLLPKEGYSY